MEEQKCLTKAFLSMISFVKLRFRAVFIFALTVKEFIFSFSKGKI